MDVDHHKTAWGSLKYRDDLRLLWLIDIRGRRLPSMCFAQVCLRSRKCSHVSVWVLGFILLCQLQLNCTQPARPSPRHCHYRHSPPTPPSEPFIQIVLPRIPRQRQSAGEEGGKESRREAAVHAWCSRGSAGPRVGEVESGSRAGREEVVEGEEG